jgi:predicted nucleic-acid-binding protein
MSIAVDTNILVRFLTRDDQGQFVKAKRFLSENDCMVQTTVILELEWILRSVYRYDPENIAQMFNMILDTDGLEIEEPLRLQHAVRGMLDGLEFADSFHFAGAAGATAFATFDRNLAKRASRTFSKPPVVQP